MVIGKPFSSFPLGPGKSLFGSFPRYSASSWEPCVALRPCYLQQVGGRYLFERLALVLDLRGERPPSGVYISGKLVLCV